MNPLADCRNCGVCCFSALDAYVRVTGEDWDRLGQEAEWWAHFIGNRAYMKMHEGHCAALELRPSPKGSLDFFCSIYEQRPQVCRDLGRGSAQCAGEIAAKGERVAAWADCNNSAPATSCSGYPVVMPPLFAGGVDQNIHHGLAH